MQMPEGQNTPRLTLKVTITIKSFWTFSPRVEEELLLTLVSRTSSENLDTMS